MCLIFKTYFQMRAAIIILKLKLYHFLQIYNFCIIFQYQQMDSPINPQPRLQGQQSKNERPQQKNQNEDQLKKQVSRRSRKDIQGRDFVCGCGKKYLSYPALYTHIKTKHDGRQPEGTMKYSTAAPAKKTKTKLEQQHLNQMFSLLGRQDLRLLDIVGQKFRGATSLSSRLKSKILQKQITDTYHSLLKNTTSPLKLNKQNPLQQHLVAFLLGVGQYITQKLHQQYQWFARTVKQCYYQMGSEVYNKCFSKKQGGLCYVPNFKVQKVKYFPLICDFYIRFFLPYEYPELNSNLMELILTDFCNWLNKRKCTFIEIVLNKQYKLLAPLQFEQQIKPQLKNDSDHKNEDDEHDKSNRSEIQDLESLGNQNIKQESSVNNQMGSKSVNMQQKEKNQILDQQNNLDSQIIDNNSKQEHSDYQRIQQQPNNHTQIKQQMNNHVNNHKVNNQKGQQIKLELNSQANEQTVNQIIMQNQQGQSFGNPQLINLEHSEVNLNKEPNNTEKMSKHWSMQAEAAQQSSQSLPVVETKQQKNQSQDIPIQKEQQNKEQDKAPLSDNL